MDCTMRRCAPVVALVSALAVGWGAAPATAEAGAGSAPVPAVVAHEQGDDRWDGDRDRWDDHDRWDDNDRWGDRDGGRGHGRGRDRDRRWDDSRESDWDAVAGFAANNGGEGYWVLTKGGRVFAMEGAPDLGSVDSGVQVVGMAGHPSAEGFWVLDAEGTVSAFGAAVDHGSASFPAVGIAAHRTGEGYWIAARDGRVSAFGVAQHHGDAREAGVTVDRIVARDDADGYYLRASQDRWFLYPRPQRTPPGRDWDEGHDRDHDDGHAHDGKPRRPKPPKPPKRPKPPTTGKPRPPKDSVSPPQPTDPSLVTVQGITVDKRIAGKTRRLLRAANRAGVRLGGWGHRSHARQIELRRAHCGTTRYAIYRMPSSQCRPPTARPGSSMHEHGLAIDFYKRGAGGKALPIAGTRAFRWLKANAKRFGFYNLPSEPWHWSVNGR